MNIQKLLWLACYKLLYVWQIFFFSNKNTLYHILNKASKDVCEKAKFKHSNFTCSNVFSVTKNSGSWYFIRNDANIPVSQRRDDQPQRISQIFVSVQKLRVHCTNVYVVLLPVISAIFEKCLLERLIYTLELLYKNYQPYTNKKERFKNSKCYKVRFLNY